MAAFQRPVVPEDSALVSTLHELANKQSGKSKLVKSSVYDAPADPEIKVHSWKMDEYRYYDVPSPFPTLARGLFTVTLPSAGKDGKNAHRIVARGYDKFFNIGEVPWTTWPSLEEHTAGPYTASLKSNGCIIFIAALTPDKLIITSKHSIGPVVGQNISHAEAGEGWLRKYLAEKGKAEADFAKRLWDNNWTAIAELCDDSFEEHVLGYSPEKTGLHLHGLNTSTSVFHTLPHSVIDAFADEWGFIRTPSLEFPTLAAVRAFTDGVSAAGHWECEPVEGFVVRTHVTSKPGDAPYAPGSTFFFKIKFDEPYMMYRDWRELTKSLLTAHDKGLSGKGAGMSEGALSKGKMRRPESKVYVRWVMKEIVRDPETFAQYGKNKGIIATRDKFMVYLASEEGQQQLALAKENRLPPATTADTASPRAQFGKTVIVPVAIPGSGKTAVAVALTHIFGFGHTQSDDVKAKKAAPIFLKNVNALLTTHDVVIADKNNHLKQHRAQLRQAVAGRNPPVRLLALNWALDANGMTSVDAHRICSSRITKRGENHQTLRPDETGDAKASHGHVVSMFIKQTDALVSEEVDGIIEMSIDEGMDASIRRAVDGLVRELELLEPTEQKIQEGIQAARDYVVAASEEPQAKKPAKADSKKGKEKAKEQAVPAVKKPKPPRYYGLVPDFSFDSLVGSVSSDPKAAEFLTLLREKERITARPHVTLVHSKALSEPGAQDLWGRCARLDLGPEKDQAVFTCKLNTLLWDGRVMAVVVDDLKLDKEGREGQVGAEFVSMLGGHVRSRLHLTVGTKDPSIHPVEAKAMVESWRAGKTGIKTLQLDEKIVQARVKGLFS
ncbi:unnamed protein product [Mycena citricolor]|uniref:tRNA ligase n=1 Tax=Mycena citricolor TaxID=2018698 RepID=A0AAD2HQ86_9AGAR|nr:unnamed protein product [Mycena citricolor]